MRRKPLFGLFLSAAALIVVWLALVLALPTGGRARSQSAATLTATTTRPPTLDISPLTTLGVEPTRARSALVSPTPTATEDLPAPVLTLTALGQMWIATYAAIPTETPGPSAISLTGKPHFVEFYADWCGPCREMRPALKKMKEKYGETVTFWDIDVDNIGSDALSQKYRVQFIPYMVLLDKEGKTFRILEGYQTQKELDAALSALLALK